MRRGLLVVGGLLIVTLFVLGPGTRRARAATKGEAPERPQDVSCNVSF